MSLADTEREALRGGVTHSGQGALGSDRKASRFKAQACLHRRLPVLNNVQIAPSPKSLGRPGPVGCVWKKQVWKPQDPGYSLPFIKC